MTATAADGFMVAPEFERMERPALRALQLERLRPLLAHAYANVAHYRKSFDAAGVKPDDLRHLEDLARFPFIVKSDLRDNYPFGLFAVPRQQVIRLHASSGTTGKPTVVGYTEGDLDTWAGLMARTLAATGVRPGDVVHNAYGYGLFTGGLGFHYGAERLKCSVVPMSGGNTEKQIGLIVDFGARVLAATPSYALNIAEVAEQMGVDLAGSDLRIGVFGAEPWSESMRAEIEDVWNMLATDIYGLSEIIGPGVAQECTYKEGLHIFSDVFYPEIINPETGEEMPEGQDGELVITTLTKRAIPLIRYRTRDIVCINYEKCRCGRTSPRISKIKGRTDDMIVVRGINVFPSQIEHVLLGIEKTHPHYQIVVDRKAHKLDEVEVLVEVDQKMFSDEIKQLEELRGKIKKEIESVLNIGVRVTLVEPKTIERSMGKAKRVVDKRSI